MDIWIETAAGSLIKSDAVTHIVIREDTPGLWFVSVSASAPPAQFASVNDEAAAKTVRNRLVIAMADHSKGDGPHVLTFNADSNTVDYLEV